MPSSPAQPAAIDKPRLLVGEGDDEVSFFRALVAACHLDDVQVEKTGGKDGLRLYLRELPNRPGYERLVALGITRDADDDCVVAFQRVCTLLGAAGFSSPPAAGQVVYGPLRVGVFILPDNGRPGMLEDLCLDSVAADPAFPCLAAYFQCVLHSANRQPGNAAKARCTPGLRRSLNLT